MTDETRLAVAALEDKTVNELRTLYEEVFDEVCRSRHKKYLVRRIAWRLQALDEGGLSNEAKQKARELAATSDFRMTAAREEVLDNVRRVTPEVDGYVDWDPRLPPPGSFLEQRYKGQMVRVLVLTDGFEYEGKRFRSLSKVAAKSLVSATTDSSSSDSERGRNEKANGIWTADHSVRDLHP